MEQPVGGRRWQKNQKKRAKDGIEQIQSQRPPFWEVFLFWMVSTLSYGLGLDQTMFNIAGMLLPLQIISNGRKRKARNRRKGERAGPEMILAAVAFHFLVI